MKNRGIFYVVCAVDILLLAGCIFLYMGQDRTAPVISFDNNEIIYTEAMKTEAVLEGVDAYDSRDGDVSSSLLVESISRTPDGRVIVTYAARDKSNNIAKNSRILTGQDDVSK